MRGTADAIASSWIPSGPQPCSRDVSCTSQSVSEPADDTESVFPLRSLTLLIVLFGATTIAMFAGARYISATPIAGTPFAR